MFYRLADLTAAKQARDASHDRHAPAATRPAAGGHAADAVKVATSYAKQAAFAGLNRLGGESVILRRKVTATSPPPCREARDALEAARSAAVPGWSD